MSMVDNPDRMPGFHIGSTFKVATFVLLLLLILPSSSMWLNQSGSTPSSSSQTGKTVLDKSTETTNQISDHSYTVISPVIPMRVSTSSYKVSYSIGASYPSFYLPPKQSGARGTGPRGAATQSPYSHGGPIMDTPVVYLLFWRPTGYNFDTSPSDDSYIGLISQYFKDVSSSGLYNILTQYYGSNGQPSNQIVLGGSYIYNGAFPNSRGSSFKPLLDSDI